MLNCNKSRQAEDEIQYIIRKLVQLITGGYGRRKKAIQKDEVMDLLTEYATKERLSRIVEDDEEIKAARIHSQEKFSELETTLTEEQKKLLETFITADSEEVARMEFLTYQQGLKDMFNLIMSLMDKQGEQAGVP